MSSAAALLWVPRLGASDLHNAPWSTNVPISDPEAIPRNPVVALDTTGRAYVAWHDNRSGAARGIYVASQLASDAWTTPVKIPGSDAGNPSSSTIAAGAAGQVYVAWVSGFPETRADIRFAWSADGGLTWQEPVQVNTDHQDIAGQPDLTVDAHGNVHLVWSDLGVFGDPHSRDVKWSMRLAGQEAWTAPAVVHPDVEVFTEQARPAITADGAGNVYAVWEDARHGPDDTEAIYAARLLAGSPVWEPGRRVDHRVGETNERPDVAAAVDGTLYTVWDAGSTGAIYSAILRSGAEVWDGPTPVRRVEGGKGEKGKGKREEDMEEGGAPRIAVDRRGVAYAVWQDDRNGNLDIYAAVRWPGATQWGQNVRVNDDEGTAIQEAPAIAAGGAGRVITVWNDQRHNTTGIVYAAQLELVIYAVRLPFLTRAY